jgi:hypothetical protein
LSSMRIPLIRSSVPRDTEVRVPSEILGELRGRGSLHSQVHFEPDHLGERLHHLDRLEPSQRGLQPLTQTGEPQEQVEVAGKRRGDTRTQHLDGNLMPVGRPSEMDLGDRSGRYRPLVKGCEQIVERAGELGLDQCTSLGARERREVVLQAGEIGSDLFAEEIGSGGQKLAELYEARPQFFERGGEPLTRSRQHSAAAARKELTKPHKGHCGRDGRQRRQRIVPGEG